MTETDNPLKALITLYGETFAAWLLDRAVRHVRPLNVEFPARAAQSDLLFEVIDEEGTLIYLHIELQGRRSHEPMPLRMLDYLSRIVRRELSASSTEADGPRLHSVVLYVGEGAGRNDEGVYEIQDAGTGLTLRWRYHPIRLWEMPAVTLLQLGQPALLALIGQTKLR